VLERALDAGVERVQPVESQGLGCAEAAAALARATSVGSMMRQHAMEQGGATFRRQPSCGRAHDLRPEREVPDQTPLLGDPELRPVTELARLADVVHESGRHQQV